MDTLKQSGFVGGVTAPIKPRPANDQEQSKRQSPQQRRRKPDSDSDHKIDEYA